MKYGVIGCRVYCTYSTCPSGARVDVEDKEGNTALHIAARHGHASVVKTLISYGASVLKSVVYIQVYQVSKFTVCFQCNLHKQCASEIRKLLH